MFRRRSIAVLAVLVALAGACSSSDDSGSAGAADGDGTTTASTTTGEETTTAPAGPTLEETTPAVQALLDEAVDGPEGPVPAVLAAVTVGDSEPVLLAAGAGDPEGATPADPEQRVRIASVTKSVLATVVLQLVDEGLLALDDTLDQWYPQVPESGSITVEQLARNTSGLPDWDAFPDGVFGLIVADSEKNWTTAEVVDLVDELEPTFPPGTDWAYSNPGNAILTGVVEQVTGQPFAAVVAERITGPLGLDHTAVGPLDPRPDDYAFGLAEVGGSPFDWRELPYVATESIFSGAGNMTSTVADMVVFGRAVWGDDVGVLPDDLRAAMVDFGAVDSGLGTQPFCPCVDDEPGGVGHTGDLAGSRTVVAHYAASDVTVALAVMTNIVDRDVVTDLLEAVAAELGA